MACNYVQGIFNLKVNKKEESQRRIPIRISANICSNILQTPILKKETLQNLQKKLRKKDGKWVQR